MSIGDIVGSVNTHQGLSEILEELHRDGPVNESALEALSYYKVFHPEEFFFYEERVLSALGLFYKNQEPSNLYSLLMSEFGVRHKEDYGVVLTPVQASMRRAIDDSRFVSISAPTSAGKSYSIRDYIAGIRGNAVVVVPTRALIAEYVKLMRRRFYNDKNVMILSHVDDVFKNRSPRKIFILTPERARELFLDSFGVDVDFFFFDEAQVSDEGRRGIHFDVLVRRVERKFPNAKLFFAHPFIENPEAQFRKHRFPEEDGFSKSYRQAAVGKIFVHKHSQNKKYYYFSPHVSNGHHIQNCVDFRGRFEDFALDGEKAVLVYVSKRSIYNGKFLDGFARYVDKLQDINDAEAVSIIDKISSMIGADNNEHQSRMVFLMRKGVVIHHGSIPLEARLLVEDFITKRFAKLCFATSTLAQGVNMPFDIVWLESMRFLGGDKRFQTLAFKNLIGRAGRLSNSNSFDYGYIYTKSAKLFIDKISSEVSLSDESILDQEFSEDDDEAELVYAINNNEFDDDKNLPLSKLGRLSSDEVVQACQDILERVYREETIKASLSGAENKGHRDSVNDSFLTIYEASLGRELKQLEFSIFMEGMGIFLHVIQGRSFKEIVALRYNWISRKDSNHLGFPRFSPPAHVLPNIALDEPYSLFSDEDDAGKVGYDRVVYDTYDYIDKVITFSLVDVFVAAFKVYKEHLGDPTADKMIELLRYGTNNSMNTLLLRYGFPAENLSEISEYVQFVNEYDIIFKDNVRDAPAYICDLVEWYLP